LSDILVDTNILVYPHDPRDREKQERARGIIDELVKSERAFISVQCLTEFFRSVRWRLPEPLHPADAFAQVKRISEACEVLDLTLQVVLEACRASNRHQMSIWDALIWAAAKVNEIPYILTEDAEHNRFIEGVRYLNPFAAEFEMNLLEA